MRAIGGGGGSRTRVLWLLGGDSPSAAKLIAFEERAWQPSPKVVSEAFPLGGAHDREAVSAL